MVDGWYYFNKISVQFAQLHVIESSRFLNGFFNSTRKRKIFSYFENIELNK